MLRVRKVEVSTLLSWMRNLSPIKTLGHNCKWSGSPQSLLQRFGVVWRGANADLLIAWRPPWLIALKFNWCCFSIDTFGECRASISVYKQFIFWSSWRNLNIHLFKSCSFVFLVPPVDSKRLDSCSSVAVRRKCYSVFFVNVVWTDKRLAYPSSMLYEWISAQHTLRQCCMYG